MLSEQAKEKIRQQMARYPVPRSALGHALYVAQEECGGWIPYDAIKDIAEVMDLEPTDVQSMMSFYVMYNKGPVGKYLIEICHNIACNVMGSQKLVDVVERKCHIHAGETSEDGLFTLKTIECNAACGGGPNCQVNGTYYENLTVEQFEQLLDRLAREGGPKPGENIYNAVYQPDLDARLKRQAVG
jgi:NADH-quinone oxidoreductase subunit E